MTAPVSLRVEQQRLLAGCGAALRQPTALADVAVEGGVDAGGYALIRAGIDTLFPEEPLYGVDHDGWPGAFLADRSRGSESADRLLAEWVVALTIALQRWARDPVWVGRVVEAEDNLLRLAIPWQREALFNDALRVALRLIELWSQPGSNFTAISDSVRRGLEPPMQRGLSPGNHRFTQAAFARGIPYELLTSCVQFGWGAHSVRMDQTFTWRTGFIGTVTARDHVMMSQMLAAAGMPVTSAGPGESQAGHDEHHLLIVNGSMLSAVRSAHTGMPAADLTQRVHPENRRLAERAARVIGLDIAGVGLLTADISRPWHEAGGEICVVQPQPSLQAHSSAQPLRDINGEILDIMFGGSPPRIPTAAITGTAQTNTVALLLSRIWTAAGAVAGLCTRDSLSIGEEIVSTGDLSGSPGARIILTDPRVQAAVFEIPPSTLADRGHPCDRYGVAALWELDASDEMVSLMAEVLERTDEAIVVDADDPRSMAMRSRAATARHILVSRHPAGPALNGHLRQGGEAAFTAEHDGRRWIILASRDSQTPVMPVTGVDTGSAVLAAALGWAQGVDVVSIRQGLGWAGGELSV